MRHSPGRFRLLLFIFALSGLLALGLLLFLGEPITSVQAGALDLFVKVNGSGSSCLQASPCELSTALNQATAGNTIYLAGGTYTGSGSAVVTVTASITLYGGWDGTTATPIVRNPESYPSLINGQTLRRGVYMTGTVSPILDGLALINGDAFGLGGDSSGLDAGGGLYANNASPMIVNCRVQDSSAQLGGGMAFYGGAPTIVENTILENIASRAGGGLYLNNSSAAVLNNQINANIAGGADLHDGGAGLYMNSSLARFQYNIVMNNFSLSHGGGVYVYNSPALVSSNYLWNNRAEFGGGLFLLQSPATVDSNEIIYNRANISGGGMSVIDSEAFVLKNNILGLNNSTETGPALYVTSYDPRLTSSTYTGSVLETNGIILHNTFADNSSTTSPWTIWAGSSTGPTTTLTMTNILIGPPGGIWVDPIARVSLNSTLFDLSLESSGLTISGTGTIISQSTIFGDPSFILPFFHIGPYSAARDAGVPAGLFVDIDGQYRPNGLYPDIGADEYWPYLLMPVIITGESG